MAWDIYGNDLRKGYCEVHPHVEEEYPCSLCYAENKQRENERRRQEQDTIQMYTEEEVRGLVLDSMKRIAIYSGVKKVYGGTVENFAKEWFNINKKK